MCVFIIGKSFFSFFFFFSFTIFKEVPLLFEMESEVLGFCTALRVRMLSYVVYLLLFLGRS